MGHILFIGLGTNLGDRRANLKRALDSLASRIELSAESPVYETEPWGFAEQPDFLNQVVRGRTDFSPEATLAFLKETEAHLGRKPGIRFGPRLIDLDLLLYDDRVMEDPGLQIPHPGLAQRAFVLVPLADLAPDLIHPVLGKTIRELLMTVDASGVRLLKEPANEGLSSEASG